MDSPARVPVNSAGGSYGNWGLPRFFRGPRAAGMIGRRSPIGLTDMLDGPAHGYDSQK